MILYFSGTGNSAYVAKYISRMIKDEVLDLFQRLRDHDYSAMASDKPWVVVTPTYAWRIPRIVSEWMRQTKLTGSKEIYFVLTCGDGIGNAGAYLEKFCDILGMKYMGCAQIVMPENYIAMFQTPGTEEAKDIIRKAAPSIDEVCAALKKGKPLANRKISPVGKICSGVVNKAFYPMFVHADKFTVKNTCVSCGKCEKLCPMSNVKIKNGKPVWGKSCTHCMACICHCPTEAIEYGRHSKGLPRYVCPE